MTPLRRFYHTAFSTRNGAFTIACVTTAAFVFLGHDGRRAAQMLALAMPALLWLLYPIESRALRLVRAALVWTVVLCFMADGAGRAYLLDAYQATPDSSMVLGAIANTTQEESREFLEMYWRQAATWLIAIMGAGGLLGFTLLRHAQVPVLRRSAARLSAPGASSVAKGSGASRFSRVAITSVVALMLLTSAVGYASKPWRRMHPVIFWAAWTESVTQLRADWGHQEGARRVALERAMAQHPTLVDAGPSTVVLVISESINRDNLGMYGYARATTPGMSRQHDALGGNFLVMRNAWSVDATTVPGVRNILNVGGRDAGTLPASTTWRSKTFMASLPTKCIWSTVCRAAAVRRPTPPCSHP
jgi:heptose-I-phosphate ethanolaminephosphotransferase